MSISDPSEKKSLKSRLTMAVAGLALAGALATGAAAAVDVEPVSADETTETAWEARAVKDARSFRGYSRGLSWQ